MLFNLSVPLVVNSKITEIAEPATSKRSAAAAGLEAAATEELSKSQKKKLNKKLKGESGEAAPAPSPVQAEKKAAAPAPAAKKEEKTNKKVHGNGLVTEDSKLGTGVVAKAGKKVGMRYIGKLANGKVFDSNTNGKPVSSPSLSGPSRAQFWLTGCVFLCAAFCLVRLQPR